MKNHKPRNKKTASDLLEGTIPGKVTMEAFAQFIQHHPASRFSKNLRRMLLEFLMYDGAAEAKYLQDLLYDMDGLFDLLDAIEIEDEAKR